MSVILRCPKCGTTGGSLGGCDACHEADVRYYCANHEPGRWLETPVCLACEARGREAARPAAASPAPRPQPARRSREAPARVAVERSRPVEEAEYSPAFARKPLWEMLLRTAVAARGMRVRAAPTTDGMTAVGKLGGCLARLVGIAIVLCAAAAGALYLFGRSLM